jgi:hypothetical protein
MSKFTVRTHTWVNGVLKTQDHKFANKDSAVNFALNHDCTIAKVTDPQNRVVYQQNNKPKLETKPFKPGKKRNDDFDTYA